LNHRGTETQRRQEALRKAGRQESAVHSFPDFLSS
jgi:hypothetical protein